MGEPAVAYSITPSAFQLPPRGVLDSSTTVCVGPPSAEILNRRPCVKNARNRLSGDQNGKAAPSVPGSERDVKLSIGRTHNDVFPAASSATKASIVPSGEIVPPFDPSGAPSGDAHEVLSGAL